MWCTIKAKKVKDSVGEEYKSERIPIGLAGHHPLQKFSKFLMSVAYLTRAPSDTILGRDLLALP